MQCPMRATAAEAAYDERRQWTSRSCRDNFLLTRQTIWNVPEHDQVNALELLSSFATRWIASTYVDVGS